MDRTQRRRVRRCNVDVQSASAEHRAMPRLHHLALRTQDLPRLLAFYQRWLGLHVRRDQRPRSVWLALEPDAVLMLELAAADEPRVPSGSLELVAFAVTVEQRLQLRDQLLQEGLLEAETEHTLYLRDPDGRRVALSSYPF
jgi:catechol 2,3-dioxygenase-like lactoylglutathione lyase family enzyme